MAQKRVKTKFTGVYVRETTDPQRKHNGKPDRAYDYSFRDENGKMRWETAGWLSQGMSEKAAFNIRFERIASIKKPPISENVETSTVTAKCQLESVEIPLFSTLAENYLRWLEFESKYADRERFRYDTHLQESLGGKYADQISISDADGLKHQLMPKMAIGSVKKCLNLCRAIYFHASVSGTYTGLNPFSRQSGFKQPKGATECERFLTPDEANLLLKELEKRSPQLRDMCYVSLNTGIRPCELFGLRGGDIVPHAKFFWVSAKGGKREKIPTDTDIIKLLLSYKRSSHEYIFQKKGGGKINQTSDTLRRTVEDLGISPRTVMKEGRKEVRIKMTPAQRQEYNQKKVWMHTFRHTYASWLAQSGTVTLIQLRDLLRHESIQMTERYAHLMPDSIEQKSTQIKSILQAVSQESLEEAV